MSGPEIIPRPLYRRGNQGPGRDSTDKWGGGETGEVRVLKLHWPSGSCVFVHFTDTYRTLAAINPNSLCHPWKTEDPERENDLLRSQGKLGAESEGEPKTSVPRVSSHIPSCQQPECPSGGSSPHSGGSSPHCSCCLQPVFIERPLEQAPGRGEAPTSTVVPLWPAARVELS